MGTNSSARELYGSLTSLNSIHVQHLQLPNCLIHQEGLLLLNTSGFQVYCTEWNRAMVNKDSKDQPDTSLSLSSSQGTPLTCQAVLLVQQGH